MDETEVTNEQFAKFVKATGYVTVADASRVRKTFPGAPPENLVAGSVVFPPPGYARAAERSLPVVELRAGANWRHPLGPQSDINGKERYPVVHVAYEDAVAYASGRASDCQPRRNGNSPPGAG